jgi:hypothetical protein
MPDEFDIEDKERLVRIDERTQHIEEKVDGVEGRVDDVEDRAQKNRNAIAKFTVIIGGAASAIGAIGGVAIAKLWELF